MSDDTRGLFGRLKAALAQDGDPESRARDEKPIAVTSEERTDEPDSDIDRWIDEYQSNPLINVPVRNFAADVMEPGIAVDIDEEDVPSVPSEYWDPEYRGLDLDAALERWLRRAAVQGGSFGHSTADLLEDAVKDLRGRRGSALIEHAYDDPEERDRILGLRLFGAEDVTAYTRPGRALLMRPDDGAETLEDNDRVFGRQSLASAGREIPTTPANKTAAFVQYDDIYLSSEQDEIPFALNDVTFVANDPDTGDIFGRPDTASVLDRATAIRNQFDDMDGAIKALAYGHWVAQVDTDNQQTAETLVEDLDPTDSTRINAVNYAVELDQFEGQSPDIVDNIQQEIEFVLSAMPTPLYRVGFAGDINRDITGEQREDYRDEVRRERDRLESALRGVLQMKAREFLTGDAHAESDDVPDVRPRIEPEDADSPLEDEEFDADEFASMMQGIKAAVGTGGGRQVIPIHELRERVLGLPAEPPDPPDADVDAAAALPDETDPAVQAAFKDAYLGTRYSEGDVVQTPQGVGVVAEVRTESFEGKDGEVDASTDSPTYVVGLKDARVGVGFYRASELSAGSLPDPNVDDPIKDVEASADLAVASADLADSSFSYPPSWQESETPARVILLDVWASLNGQFDCGGGCCMGEFNDAEFCASLKDKVLGGWEGWRKGG